MFYLLYDLVLESRLPLPELAQVTQGPADLTFHLCDPGAATAVPMRWDEERRLPDGRVWLLLAVREGRTFLRLLGQADFLICPGEKAVYCYAQADTPLESVRHALLNLVVPLVLSLRDRLILHGSAVATPRGEAVAFLGPSRSGKSTLAASFSVDGWRLLADDSFLLREENGQLWVKPSYPGLRLWPEAVAGLLGEGIDLPRLMPSATKYRVDSAEGRFAFSPGTVPLRRAYLLSGPDAAQPGPCSLRPLFPREALLLLARSAIRLDLRQPERMKAGFESYAQGARRPIFRQLSYRREFPFLSEVRRTILEDVGRL